MTRRLITRRHALAACSLLSGCGLAERPYAEQRRWPLLVPRPTILPARSGGKVIELRPLAAGPGLEGDLLQEVGADGSLVVQFYERWAVPPADGVTAALRLWLSQSGRFAAVVSPGSRAAADIALEGEVTALMVDLRTNTARAAIAMTAIRLSGRQILLQATLSGAARLGEAGPVGQVRAQIAALAEACGKVEEAVLFL